MGTELICLAVAAIGGLLLSRLTKLLNLPAVTAYLVAGLLLGPYCIGALGINGVGFGTMEQVEAQSILTSLKMMEVMMAKKKTLNQLCDGLSIYPQVLKNVNVADKALAQNDPDVQAAVAEVAAKLGDSGRILVRESGTEPKVRVMVEAESLEICREYVDHVVDTIKRKGHAV